MSVDAQTLAPLEHLVWVDRRGEGSAKGRNLLAKKARGEWLAFLDDDDLLLPDHLSALDSATEEADIVYTRCGSDRITQPDAFDPESLLDANYIPVTSGVRRAVYRSLGGMITQTEPMEDWNLWVRALGRGARFVFVDRVTWTYRHWEGNRSVGSRA